MRAPADGLTSRVVTPRELSPVERSAWQRLTDSEPALRSPFFSLAYVEAVAAVHPGVRVCVLQVDDVPTAFFPFQFANRWQQSMGAAERVGEEMTDYCGLIAPAGFRLASGELLAHAGLAYFLFSHLDMTQLAYGLDGEDSEPGLRVRFSDGGGTYWQALRKRDKSFVADTERRERKLAREVGPLRFSFRAPDAPGALDLLIEHKRSRYAETGVGDALSAVWKRALLSNLCSSDALGCAGLMSTLYAGEQWVALHFGLRAGDTLHYWFPVYNPALTSYAPGRLLLKALILAADANGLAMIDRGAGDTVAKRDFANDSHSYYRGAWRRAGLRSALVRGTLSLQWRVAALWRQ